MTDPAAGLRPATPEEWPAFSRAMLHVFGEDASGPFVESVPEHAELDRSLGLWDGERVVATAGIYSRELTVPGAVVPCAGVTWVTVSPTHRRRGVLRAIMRRQLTELHEQGREAVAALWASEASIYGRFGYAPATWRGNLSGATQRLRLRPGVDAGAGRVDLVPVEEYRAAAVALYDRVRRFVPGNLARGDVWWDRALRDEPAQRHGATERRYLLHTDPDGTVSGYAAYRVKDAWTDGGEPDGTLTVEEVRATGTPAYAALWQFLFAIDLVRTVKVPMASDDDPLRHLLADPRALHARPLDALWVRLVDVGRALAARRYTAPINLVLEVRDRSCPWNDGRWALTAGPSGGFCARTDSDPDLVVDVEALAAAYLGGTSLATLQAAGRVTEVSPGAVTQAATSFRWPVSPWCPDEF
ncbi:GNAT family N-acetyltransferase [Geodermatophilus sabuli]|uniref:Predicted acetyltransferase n=1 Tax=Geodermatophilus sabuli TaxID=1564158 RepID=A0A285E622_9ACTN|nr:GNAT family N-acetyltransferase [Geodermatophilus sabuli]MBB3082659.1 putative acetyltransferase [Geodermatophilus sabuli]SNX94475.1 Predicted acetyltransferase [Geodermatophilus sabuli]